MNLKELRKSQGLTLIELAQKVGVSAGTISRWQSGEIANMKRDKIALLAKALGVKATNLLDLPDSSTADTSINFQPKGVRIPILGYVVAGVPIEAVEDILGYEEISTSMAATGEFFCLKVKGDSMEPTFTEGDILVIRQQPDVESNEIAVVLVNGDEGTVKRIKKSPTGITLIGDNVNSFLPVFYTNEEIQQLPVTIAGKVVELRRSF